MISYNTTTLKITITEATTTRALYGDVQTTFAGETYMQYLNPMVGNIRDALYILANGWELFDATSLSYLYNGGLIDTAIANRWTNVKTISGDDFTGVQLYYDQTGTPTDFAVTGLVNLLLKVRNAGTDINSQQYSVYQRTFGRNYSEFSVTASAGGIDTVPLSNTADSQITLDQAVVDAYADLTITWDLIYRSAFDGASTTKYTLDGAIDDEVTSVVVNEAIDAGVPASGYIQIGSEVMAYSSWATKTFTISARGASRTTASSHADLANVSTNTKAYSTVIKTTSSARRLSELYQWVQSQLTKATDIDSLEDGHIGKLTNELVSYTGTMVTNTGVWVEGFSSLDANSITFTDNDSATHTPPLTVSISVTIDTAVIGAQVYVAIMDTVGLTDATYTPANIERILINQTSSGEANSVSMTYTENKPARVIVRLPGYSQFSLYTTITSAGLSVTAQTPADGTY